MHRSLLPLAAVIFLFAACSESTLIGGDGPQALELGGDTDVIAWSFDQSVAGKKKDKVSVCLYKNGKAKVKNLKVDKVAKHMAKHPGDRIVTKFYAGDLSADVDCLPHDTPELVFDSADTSTGEGEEDISLGMTLSAPAAFAPELEFVSEGGSASEEDYLVAAGATVPAGETVGSAAFGVVDDDVLESTENVMLKLSPKAMTIELTEFADDGKKPDPTPVTRFQVGSSSMIDVQIADNDLSCPCWASGLPDDVNWASGILTEPGQSLRLTVGGPPANTRDIAMALNGNRGPECMLKRPSQNPALTRLSVQPAELAVCRAQITAASQGGN